MRLGPSIPWNIPMPDQEMPARGALLSVTTTIVHRGLDMEVLAQQDFAKGPPRYLQDGREVTFDEWGFGLRMDEVVNCEVYQWLVGLPRMRWKPMPGGGDFVPWTVGKETRMQKRKAGKPHKGWKKAAQKAHEKGRSGAIDRASKRKVNHGHTAR